MWFLNPWRRVPFNFLRSFYCSLCVLRFSWIFFYSGVSEVFYGFFDSWRRFPFLFKIILLIVVCSVVCWIFFLDSCVFRGSDGVS